MLNQRLISDPKLTRYDIRLHRRTVTSFPTSLVVRFAHCSRWHKQIACENVYQTLLRIIFVISFHITYFVDAGPVPEEPMTNFVCASECLSTRRPMRGY